MTVFDLTGARWRKSSFSGAGNDCVELVVARIAEFTERTTDTVGAAVRDSKRPGAGHVSFAGTGWHAFMGAVKSGHLDNA